MLSCWDLLLRQLISPFSYGVIPIMHHPKIQLFLSYICCYAILPPGLRSSSPPTSLHLHVHHPSLHNFLVSSQYVTTYHLNLASCTFFDSSATFTGPLIRVLGILFLLVTPDIHLNTFLSATFILFSFTFLIGVAFMSYIMADRTTVL